MEGTSCEDEKKRNKGKKIMEWNATGIRSTGCPKNRCGDDVLNDVKKIKVKNWTYLVKNRKAWYERVQKIKTHNGL